MAAKRILKSGLKPKNNHKSQSVNFGFFQASTLNEVTILITGLREIFFNFNVLKSLKYKAMENHNLTNEFPEYESKIKALKLNDEGFKKMYVNYEEVNALIQHYEEGEQNHTTDEHLTELRKKRVHLKDVLYSYLRQTEVTAN